MSSSYKSLLFVPGNKQPRTEAAKESKADAIVFDLEDGVILPEKDAARERSLQTIATWNVDIPIGVRVNGLDTGWGIADIEVITAANRHSQFFGLPDIHGSSEVKIVSNAVAGTSLKLLPLIEQSSAVFDLLSIVQTSSRLFDVLFAAFDKNGCLFWAKRTYRSRSTGLHGCKRR